MFKMKNVIKLFTWLRALHVYLSCWFLASSVVKVTLSVQPRFLFRHLNRALLLLALLLPGVSALGEAAAGEAKAAASPGTVGALRGGDRRSEGAAGDCGDPGAAPLPLPLRPLPGPGGDDRRTESFRTLSCFFRFLGM